MQSYRKQLVQRPWGVREGGPLGELIQASEAQHGQQGGVRVGGAWGALVERLLIVRRNIQKLEGQLGGEGGKGCDHPTT